jgi:hypothetical protein
MRFPGGCSLLILSLYNILICLVAAMLYAAVNKLEANPRDAAALKILIIASRVPSDLTIFIINFPRRLRATVTSVMEG